MNTLDDHSYQLSLFETCVDFKEMHKKAEQMALDSIGFQMEGEERWEYNQNLRDETNLAFVELLRELADRIEKDTLARQKHTIKVLYEHYNDNNEVKKCG